jgi:hypothetical protein
MSAVGGLTLAVYRAVVGDEKGITAVGGREG